MSMNQVWVEEIQYSSIASMNIVSMSTWVLIDSMSTRIITLELMSTNKVRVLEIRYSSFASMSTEYEYPSPAQCWGII